jgi:hypothetical protein
VGGYRWLWGVGRFREGGGYMRVCEGRFREGRGWMGYVRVWGGGVGWLREG